MTDIGRAGMVMKGDYNSASTYEVLDVVTYNNSLYVAKQSVPAGTAPTNTTYWQVAVNGGGDKVAVDTYAYREASTIATRNYLKGDYIYVVNLSNLFKAKTNITTGAELIEPSNIESCMYGEQIKSINENLDNLNNVKKKTVSLSDSVISSFSQTAITLGNLSTFFDIEGLTQEKIIGLICYGFALSPSAILSLGIFNNALYVAATQSCTFSGTGYITVAYID